LAPDDTGGAAPEQLCWTQPARRACGRLGPRL